MKLERQARPEEPLDAKFRSLSLFRGVWEEIGLLWRSLSREEWQSVLAVDFPLGSRESLKDIYDIQARLVRVGPRAGVEMKGPASVYIYWRPVIHWALGTSRE